jgi:hypothetical protein
MRNPLFLPAVLSFPLAAVLAIAALGGIALPDVYARETALWAAQGIGQDWANLLVVVPLLIASAFFTLRGSRVSGLLLGGTLVYTAYSLVLYAFAVHFNSLFLAYSLGLGLAFYALLGVVAALGREDARSWFAPRAPVRVTGGFAVLLGGGFYVLWLSEVIPALMAHAMPKSALDAGLITNPVQVLDLGIVLPAFIVGGLALLRRRAVGYWLVPVMLAFGVLMDVALVGMVVSMAMRKVPAAGPPAALLVVMAAAGGLIVWAFLRHVQPPSATGTGSRRWAG